MLTELYQKYLDLDQLISTDSRNIIPGSIFFALKGESFDGNQFAESAIQNGAKYAVIDNPDFKISGTFVVDDVLETLQALANYHRKKSRFNVIGLTGTNGKTTTKELIKAVLSKKYNCSATKGNLNNHIGVPLTILATPPETEILIVEMGANHQGEIADLCTIAEPDSGLITNIGKAHLEGFGGFEGVIKAKSEIYSYLKKENKTIFINSDDPLLLDLLDDYKHFRFYGGNDSSCYAEQSESKTKLKLLLNLNKEKITIESHLFGSYNVPNILAAVCLGDFFKVDKADIISAIRHYIPDNNRSQIKFSERNTLVLDSYNANPSSMQAALRSFNEMDAKKKIVILGEMKELGETSREEHNKIVTLINDLNIDEVFYIGNGFCNVIGHDESCYKTTQELINRLSEIKIDNSVILIKGSRANKLEEIIKYL